MRLAHSGPHHMCMPSGTSSSTKTESCLHNTYPEHVPLHEQHQSRQVAHITGSVVQQLIVEGPRGSKEAPARTHGSTYTPGTSVSRCWHSWHALTTPVCKPLLQDAQSSPHLALPAYCNSQLKGGASLEQVRLPELSILCYVAVESCHIIFVGMQQAVLAQKESEGPSVVDVLACVV